MILVRNSRKYLLLGGAFCAIAICSAVYLLGNMPAQAQGMVENVAPAAEASPAIPASGDVNPEAAAASGLPPETPVIPQGAGDSAGGEKQSEPVNAQQAAGSYDNLEETDFKVLDQALKNISDLRTDIIKPLDVGTVVFTLWQHSLLQEAKRLLKVRPVEQGEDLSGTGIGMGGGATGEGAVVPRGLRELSLSGILFKGKDNWIVWLNGKRLAPDALPKEIMDIKVTEEYVDLKWFDAYSNLIYPVRIRPHQRFNLDSRIFLPGITGDAAAQLQSASQAQ
ncbi:MAG: hypothetical protein HYS17_09240 [Micavibrio aeruginosavorus]|uniref:Uncharacterized protein n=1 Tax=Micavibrio aeruginosavorus TaxID=349221 RepID=A0A7T5UH79_9BACT|nr:MAG: hypothetical protein HYS17_09240 [Micavibrio aeruginosavorus]